MSAYGRNLTSTAAMLPTDGVPIPYVYRFWLFLVSNVLSLLCCLFVLFHMLSDVALRRGLHYHVLIVVLILCVIWEATTVPWTMYMYMYNIVWIQSPMFCMVWKYIDTTIYTTVAKLVAWASVERHLLIFHHQRMHDSKQRYLLHYLPIVLILLYGIVLYALTVFNNNCGRPYTYNMLFCGYYSCIYNVQGFSLYEFASGGVLSSLCIGVGSLMLIIRVMCQKRRLKQEMKWRKHRKLLVQLLVVTSLFFALYLPPILLQAARQLGVPSYVGIEYSRFSVFLSYYIIFLFPFACAATLPNLRIRLVKLVYCVGRRQRRAVAPQDTLGKALPYTQNKSG